MNVSSLILRILVFYLASGVISLSAQNSNLNTLSFLQSAKRLSRIKEEVVNPNKYLKLKNIYDRLIQSKGDFQTKIPKLVLNNQEERVASIDYKKFEIVIEEKAYDVCEKYGDGAIAFLLAHELTHFFEKHAWKNEFVAEYADLKIGQHLRDVEDQIINETQADCLGGFMSYSAGYSIQFPAEQVLKELYSAYKIENLIPGYPSLAERIQLLQRSSEKLRSMVEIFDMANLLSLTGKYQEAMAYYEYILMRYQSREIVHNLGVVYLLQAIQYFDDQELKYKYPIEMDVEPILSRDAGTLQLRESLLKESIHQFDVAIGMDPNYLPSQLNKAIAYSILGELEKAQYLCELEIIPNSNKIEFSKTTLDAMVLNGVIYNQKQQKEKAEITLLKAIELGSDLGKANLQIIQGVKNIKKEVNYKHQSPQKFSNGINLEQFSKEPMFDDQKVKFINSTFTFKQFCLDSFDCNIYFNYNEDTEETNYFIITKENSTSSTDLSISIGSTLDEIKKNYGEPTSRLETSQGSIWIYDQVFFIIGKEGLISKWGSFLSKKSSY